MLFKILDVLKSNDGILNLHQLGCELGVEESALRGMMDYLVRKEYLKEEYCDSGQSCERCHKGCFSAGSPHFPYDEGRPMGYTLTEKTWSRG